MKKWYRSGKWMLIASMAIQFTGCAQQSSWLSRFSRNNDDRKLVEVEGKTKSKAATAKKSTSDKVEKASEDLKGNAADSKLAKKSSTRPKVESSDSSRTEVASSKEASSKKIAAAKTAKRTKASPDPFLEDELDSIASMNSIESKKVETKAEAARKKAAVIDPFEERDELDSEIAQASARGEQKLNAKRLPTDNAARVREVAHKVEDDLAELNDLPEWAAEPGAARAEAEFDQIAQATKADISKAAAKASTSAQKIVRGTQHVQSEVEEAFKEPVSAGRIAAAKSSAVTFLSLCPDAEGELREQILFLDTSDIEVLKRSVHRIGRMGTDAEAAAPALKQLLKHKDGFVRTHAALALVRMQQSAPEAVQTVVDGLKSSDPGLRSFAAASLSEMGPQANDALSTLSNSLNDRDGNVRLHAAEVLIRYDQWSYRSLETLLGCLIDKDENVRWLATYSLAELAPEDTEAVAALVKTTRDPVLKVRTGAVYALGEIGPFARSSVAGLRRLAEETSQPELQSAILYALQQIEK